LNEKEKHFLIYYPAIVALAGIAIPTALEMHRIGDSFSFDNIIEGGWVAILYLASAYILLALIGCFKRNLYIMGPPFIGILFIQVLNHIQVVSSTSSTAALGYLIVPVIQAILGIPIGILIGVFINNGVNSNNRKFKT
jgi:ABC-type phosphate transport system permease subunit